MTTTLNIYTVYTNQKEYQTEHCWFNYRMIMLDSQKL